MCAKLDENPLTISRGKKITRQRSPRTTSGSCGTSLIISTVRGVARSDVCSSRGLRFSSGSKRLLHIRAYRYLVLGENNTHRRAGERNPSGHFIYWVALRYRPRRSSVCRVCLSGVSEGSEPRALQNSCHAFTHTGTWCLAKHNAYYRGA